MTKEITQIQSQSKKNIQLINKLYDEGYRIILYTVRYMTRCKVNIFQVKK